MKISIDKTKLIEYAKEKFDSYKIEYKNGKIYLNGSHWAQARIAGACVEMFGLGDEKYYKLANELIVKCGNDMCHMTPMQFSKIYLEHNDKLTPESKRKIVTYLAAVKENYMGDELDFVGVNDNFPLLATYAATAMATILDAPEMLDEAKRRLNQVEKLLKRRAALSEYSSGYTAFQLYIVASLYRILPEKWMKDIAYNVETRIWADYLAHYNEKTGTFCGPYARRYLAVGEMKSMERHISILLLGDTVTREDILGNHIDIAYMLEEYCFNDCVTELLNKKFPFEFKGSVECSASTDSTPECAQRILSEDNEVYEYSAGEEKLYTYMTEKYALGTATKEWHSGIQTSSFSAAYKASYGDETVTRNIECRYIINDCKTEVQRFFEHGRKMAFGVKNRAVVAYKPKIAIVEAVHNMDDEMELAKHYRRQEVSGNYGVCEAKLLILIPLKNKDPEKIIIGDKEVCGFIAESESAESIYIKDGNIYIAVHPLTVTDKGRKKAMSVRKRVGYLELALYNYEGEEKDFARRDFLHIQNGFGFVISSEAESGTFDEFVTCEKKTVIVDRFISTVHSRQTYVRHIDMISEVLSLSCEFSPASEGIKYITCNDYPIEIPKISMTGFDVSRLPYVKNEEV